MVILVQCHGIVPHNWLDLFPYDNDFFLLLFNFTYFLLGDVADPTGYRGELPSHLTCPEAGSEYVEVLICEESGLQVYHLVRVIKQC